MPVEIERKFLVINDSWREGAQGIRIAQGYLTQDPARTVRVRIAGDEGFLTIKGKSEGISRVEYEYSIPFQEAKALLDLCLPSVIDKTRYKIPYAGHLWEVDEFHGANQGLVIAEVELTDDSIHPDLPPWVGDDVSAENRYFNACLAVFPYSQWGSGAGTR